MLPKQAISLFRGGLFFSTVFVGRKNHTPSLRRAKGMFWVVDSSEVDSKEKSESNISRNGSLPSQIMGTENTTDFHQKVAFWKGICPYFRQI